MSIVFQNKEKAEEKEFMDDYGQVVNELIAVKSKIKEIEEKYIEPLQKKEHELKKGLSDIFADYDIKQLDTDEFIIRMSPGTADKETLDVSLLEKQDEKLYKDLMGKYTKTAIDVSLLKEQDEKLYEELVEKYNKTVKGKKAVMAVTLKRKRSE